MTLCPNCLEEGCPGYEQDGILYQCLKQKNDLIKRAADLLSDRAPFLPDFNNQDWFKQRNQWLRDAGMEK